MHVIGTSARPDWGLAVVIGAGGMGTAIARRLSQRHRVLVADIDGERSAAVAEALCREGGDVSSICCDVTNHDMVERLAARVAEIGPFRALAHVAGLSPSLADYTTIMRVNLHGPALVAAALLPHARQGTAAVLIASLAAHGPNPTAQVEAVLSQAQNADLAERLADILPEAEVTPQTAYALSKYGLRMLVRRQASAWGLSGARMVSVSPGLIATQQGAIEFERSPSKTRLLSETPLAREGTMHEIADAVEFLVSDRASFISGTDLLVDGGLAGALSS